MKKLLSILLGMCCLAAIAQAESVSERIPIQGIPIAQWLMTVDHGESELIPAEGRLEEGIIEVTTDIPSVPPTMLIGGVVHLADGRIISSPLHEGVRDNLRDASAQLAATQVEELSSRITFRKSRVAELEQQIDELNADLRHRAGLDDVDKLLAESVRLQANIEKLSQLRAKAQEIR